MDTTGRALVDFWKRAGEKGLVNQNTAIAKKTACTQVLGAMDDWETLDVTSMNIDEVFRRFTNKRHNDFTPASLGTYKSRFTQALNDFLAYVNNPEGWKPSQERPASQRREKPTSNNTTKAEAVHTPAPVDTLPGRMGLVEYPFPLREGRYAYLRLPTGLKVAEVKRLTAYLMTLAEDAEIA